jgi:phage shock protein A
MNNRIKRIISGSVNGLIDAMERATPESVMTQAIREIEQAIDEIRGALGKETAARILSSKRLLEENKKHEDLSQQIEVALTEKREDLAKAALRRQYDIELQIPVLECSIVDAQTEEKRLVQQIEALQAKKREMREELSEYRLALQNRAASSHPGTQQTSADYSSLSKKIDQATETFDRILAASSDAPLPTREQSLVESAKLQELASITREQIIASRLESLKSKQG